MPIISRRELSPVLGQLLQEETVAWEEQEKYNSIPVAPWDVPPPLFKYWANSQETERR